MHGYIPRCAWLVSDIYEAALFRAFGLSLTNILKLLYLFRYTYTVVSNSSNEISTLYFCLVNHWNSASPLAGSSKSKYVTRVPRSVCSRTGPRIEGTVMPSLVAT